LGLTDELAVPRKYMPAELLVETPLTGVVPVVRAFPITTINIEVASPSAVLSTVTVNVEGSDPKIVLSQVRAKGPVLTSLIVVKLEVVSVDDREETCRITTSPTANPVG